MVFLVLLSGCDDSTDPASGPTLTNIANIVFQEADSLYLGRPYYLHVGDKGYFYVSDAFSDQIIRFSRQGAPDQVYGNRGAGPGEFESVGVVHTLDSLVVGVDDGDSEFLVFDRRSGHYRKAIEFQGTVRTFSGDSLYGSLSRAHNSSVIRWRPHMDTVTYHYSWPPSYRTYHPLASIYNVTHAESWGDTVALTYAGLDRVFLYTGAEVQSPEILKVPSTHRRGEPENLNEVFSQQSFNSMFEASSHLVDLYRLPGGRIALIHLDQNVLSATDRAFTTDMYLSVVDLARREACVDAVIAKGKTTRPVTAFRHDTLFVLNQSVKEEQASTYVNIYRVDTANCSWEPVH